jgi:hypothetical protein
MTESTAVMPIAEKPTLCERSFVTEKLYHWETSL